MPNQGTSALNVRDNLVNSEYQPLDGDKQPPVHFGERSGFQALITSPWLMRWSAIPATYQTYRTIRKNSTIALARELAVAPILASEWTIEADRGTPPEWKECIESIFMPLRDEYLATALYFGDIDFGYQCWEKIIEPKDGYLKLVRLKQLLQDITEICIGHKGGFIGVRQVGQDLGLHNSIHVGFRVEGSYLYGIPLLENVRGIYNMWMDCNEGARRYDRKIAGTHIIVEYPPGSSFDAKGTEVENSVLAASVLQNLESAGGVAVPRDMAAFMQALNLESPGWKIWIMESGSSQQVGFTERLDYLDKQFTRGIHVPERAILEGSHGTLAEAEAHGDVIFTIQDIKHRRVTNELNNQGVNQMLYLNFGKQAVNTVRLKASPIADKKKAFFAQIYMDLLGSPAGAQELQSLDLASMREQLGLPTVPNDPGQQDPRQPQGGPQLQGIPGVSQGVPGGPGKQLMAIGPDGKPVSVNGEQPPQQIAQAMANALENMSAVALSATGLRRASNLGLEDEKDEKPYIDVDWDGPKHLKVSYRQPGYNTVPASWKGGQSPSDEFAALELHHSAEYPGYFQVTGVGVDKLFRRQGYARKLYEHAAQLLKQTGYRGLISHAENRSKEADKLWESFGPTEKVGEWDVLPQQGLSNDSTCSACHLSLVRTADGRCQMCGAYPADTIAMANEGAANLPIEAGGLGGGMPQRLANETHEGLVDRRELPTEEDWIKAQRIVTPKMLAQIEDQLEQLDLSQEGPVGTVMGLKLVVVNGDWVKENVNPDFVEGDNCLHSKGIVPPGCAWVDGNVAEHDRYPIAIHEITETILEEAGWKYGRAHRAANQFEDNYRAKKGLGMAGTMQDILGGRGLSDGGVMDERSLDELELR
jgi:ribosomal protein S18 acetylase RimI-like enzyme